MWLCGVFAFCGGSLATTIFFASFINWENDQIEKGGVWINRCRAYRLTKISND